MHLNLTAKLTTLDDALCNSDDQGSVCWSVNSSMVKKFAR